MFKVDDVVIVPTNELLDANRFEHKDYVLGTIISYSKKSGYYHVLITKAGDKSTAANLGRVWAENNQMILFSHESAANIIYKEIEHLFGNDYEITKKIINRLFWMV